MDFANIWGTIKEWGPFPSGIIIGIWLARGAYNKALDLMKNEIEQMRTEKQELRQTIVAQQERIDVLHDRMSGTTDNQREQGEEST